LEPPVDIIFTKISTYINIENIKHILAALNLSTNKTQKNHVGAR
jgi:hypothetical protein